MVKRNWEQIIADGVALVLAVGGCVYMGYTRKSLAGSSSWYAGAVVIVFMFYTAKRKTKPPV